LSKEDYLEAKGEISDGFDLMKEFQILLKLLILHNISRRKKENGTKSEERKRGRNDQKISDILK